MPSIGIYYGESIRNAGRAGAKRFSWPEEWYNRAQMRRFEDDGTSTIPGHRPLALALIEGLIEREFDVAAVAGLGSDQHEGHAYSFVHRCTSRATARGCFPSFRFSSIPTIRPTRRCKTLCTARQIAEGADRELS